MQYAFNTVKNSLSKILQKRALSGLFVFLLFMAFAVWLNANSVEQSINWKSWIAGKSVSADFHYLDFLELLFRLKQSD